MIDLKGNPFYLSDKHVAWVTENLERMSLDEKIGQLFVVESKDCNLEELRSKFEVIKPGGVMFRSNPAVKINKTVSALNSWSDVPMLFAGNLCQGANEAVEEGTLFATNMSVAATGDDKMASYLGEVCGLEGHDAGINWTYAPVADIDMNFRNPITNTRTFGNDVERVSSMCAKYVSSVQKHGVASCIKHFPGDGVDERDQHVTVTVNSLSCKEWDNTYGRIYKEQISNGALSFMVGHIAMPEYSMRFNEDLKASECLPGSLSKELMTDLLRRELGFNGLIVTDDSHMAGYHIMMTREEALPTSIAAGADMLLFEKVLKDDVRYVKEGVEAGLLTLDRIDEAVIRILATKAHLALDLMTDEHNFEMDRYKKHKKWATECADHAVTLVKNNQSMLPLSSEKYKKVLLYHIGSKPLLRKGGKPVVGGELKDYFAEKLIAEGFEVTLWTPEMGINAYDSEERIREFDLAVFFINIRSLGSVGMARIEWSGICGDNSPLYDQEIPSIAVSMNSPYMLLDMPRMQTFINAYTPAEHFVDAVVEKLMGRSAFKGVSPIDPWCGREDTKY